MFRGIVGKLSGMKNESLLKFNIPTATPFVYEFDKYIVVKTTSDEKGIEISIDVEETDSGLLDVVSENATVGVPSLSLMI